MKKWTYLFTAAALTAAAVVTANLRLVHAVAPQDVVLPDVPVRGGQAITLPNGWRVTPAGRPIALPGDMPLKMIVSADGKTLFVNTGGHHDHGVQVLDLENEKLVQTASVGKDWAGMCLDPTDNTLYLSGGGSVDMKQLDAARKAGKKSDLLNAPPELLDAYDKPVLRLQWKDGALQPGTPLAINGLEEKNRYIAGIAHAKDALFVVNMPTDTVYRLSGSGFAAQQAVKVGYRPYALAVSPDGNTVAVSNWGDQSVSLLDAATGKEKARVKVGSHPNELLYGPDGRLFVACAGSNSVSVLNGAREIETIKTSLDPKAPVGSTPDALALTADGKRLFVANADNNDVCVVDVSNAKEARGLGFIPTGWYPSALAVSPDGKQLYVGTGKGMKFRSNLPVQSEYPNTTYDGKHQYDYIGKILSGTVSVVDMPDETQLAAYTKQVFANVPHTTPSVVDPAHIADVTQDAFVNIKHVLYIIRENRTYDQVFGDLTGANGDNDLTMYGENITPNAHALARNTVILDNLYCNGEVSEDGHEWCNAAYCTDFKEKAWPNSYSGRGEPDADERLSESPAGYLWDNCRRHNISYRSYGEYADFKATPDAPPTFTGNRSLKGHASLAWWKTNGRDPDRANVFIAELKQAEKTGNWPQYMVMSLGEDHTDGLSAGAHTPFACVASNDQALGRMVEAISKSRFWKETAIFVIEDDAQNGVDHVDAHRTVGLVISPYVKRGVVDSTFYTTSSMVRTIELILGLPPMTQYDTAATPLYNVFTGRPTLEPFTCLPARTDLEAKNPTTGEGARKSAMLDFRHYDRADPDVLNAILWQDAKPGIPMPAPVRSACLRR